MDRMMLVQAVLVVIVCIQCIPVMCNTTEAKMSNVTDNSCGNVYVLSPSHEVRLTSDGLVPQGYCGVSVFTPKEVDAYQCDAICVTYKTASISTCEVKVKFVGHKFRKGGDLVKEYNCHHQSKDAFCWDVQSLRIEVVESYNYAYVAQKPLYEFDIDVSARCSKDSMVSAEHTKYHAIRKQHDEDEKQTYIEGIAVGISLACVFLIVLFVAWCYTKHQAVSGGRSSSSEPRPRQQNKQKGSFITTFRKKFHIRQKGTEADDEPEAIYRKTDTPTETKASNRDSEITIPLTKESDAETFELANETPTDSHKDDVEDSPKDGGAESSKMDLPEVVISPGTPLPPEETD